MTWGLTMLVGQDIGLSEVIWISLFGMAVATIAIIMLMIFVIVIGKIIMHGKRVASVKKTVSEKAFPVSVPDLQPAVTAPALAATAAAVTEDELVGITAAVCTETGMRPEQFRIVSITGR